MESESKGQKLSVETDISQCQDRISNLPPELIGNILSLLLTKEAVATSVLSSRWKWFWTFITRLEFPDSRAELNKPSFISFVYRLLLYRKPLALDYFSVSCDETKNISHFRAWVSASLLVDAKELDLSIKVDNASHVLPFQLFSCKKLVKLTLSGNFQIDVPAFVGLPSLEALSLKGVTLREHDSLKRLFIGCPVLEELCIDNFFGDDTLVLPQELFSSKTLAKLELFDDILLNVPTLVSFPSIQAIHLDDIIDLDDDSIKRLICGCPSLQKLQLRLQFDILRIESPTLSHLVVRWEYLGRTGNADFRREIVLKTPSLQFLKIDGVSAGSCVLTDLKQLMKAHIGYIHFNMQHQAITKLIMGIAGVRRLYLSGSIMEVVVKSGCELPEFHNLTVLKLDVSDNVGCALLPDLLEKSPFLEMLVIDQRLKASSGSENATWHTPQKVPYCLTHHLKVIQVNYFEGDIEDEEMFRYFIENRGALKDLTIQYSNGSGKLWDIN